MGVEPPTIATTVPENGSQNATIAADHRSGAVIASTASPSPIASQTSVIAGPSLEPRRSGVRGRSARAWLVS